MYRNIDEIINLTNAIKLIYSKNRVYKFTNSDFEMNEDYIYIPMTRLENETFEKISFHLQKQNCKGFFISEKLAATKDFLNILHKYNPENVFIVKNVYVTGFTIAKAIIEDINPELIILAGSDELNEIREKLSLNLNIKHFEYENYWQKAIDSILRLNNEDKYTIVETNIHKPKTAELIANFKENSYVVFSKISITNISTYKNLENYNNEWLKLISNNPKKIFIKENNDILNLPTVDNLIIVDDLANSILEELNIKEIIEPKEKNEKITFEKSNSLYSIKKAISKFSKKDGNKIIILDKILGLEQYSEGIHQEIMENIKEDVDLLVLINLQDFVPHLKSKNKKTKIKCVKKSGVDFDLEIKQFIDYYKNDPTNFLIISEDKNICNLI